MWFFPLVNFVHNYMQRIAYIQHTIKHVRLQFNAFSEAIKRQKVVFEGLKVIRGIGPAYRACLAENVRRKASMKLYMGMAGQLAKELAMKREDEVKRREEFLKSQSPYIPRDILDVMGLFDTPNQCDVNIVPFDTSLLDINIRDIDFYAPESLIEPPFKSKKSETSRTSVSMSSNNYYSLEAEGNAIATPAKYASQNLDICDLIDVAGTNKIEVKNAKLRADLGSVIARMSSFFLDVDLESLDESKVGSLLKDTAKKTAEALQQKDKYIKHLESKLKVGQQQCQSYEKRIEELAQQLSDQHIQTQKCLANIDATYSKADDCRSEILDQEERDLACRPSVLMEEISCTSNPANSKDELLLRMMGKTQEVDENMTNSSGMQNPQLDSSMMDPQRDEEDRDRNKILGKLGAMSPYDVATCNSSIVEPSEVSSDPSVTAAKANADLALELQTTLEDKANQLTETESRLKTALEDISKLGLELENNRKLLDESQMNCAHLENYLHETKQEAQTHLYAADRRASEYNKLRASAVKMCGLFGRLKSCVNASGGVAGFSDALHSLAQSLSSSASDGEDDGTAEFRACIRVLADRVAVLLRHRAAEAAIKQLSKDSEERKDKTLYTKHQLEKQANQLLDIIIRYLSELSSCGM